MNSSASSDDQLIAAALRSASHTRVLLTKPGVRHQAAAVFRSQFVEQQPLIVADQNTFPIAGADVLASFPGHSATTPTKYIFGNHIYANDRCVAELQQALQQSSAIPIAVGSGTINDLTKLAAHRVGRPYMAVATAASMDGYTAYGASITASGSKQTFDCPAPQAVLADLEVIAAAPPGMNASGYADLLAKIAAGADWIVADALAIEPIDPPVWATVQQRLRDWVSSPVAVATGNVSALHHLTNGLMMSGFAMQAAQTSRPASGADHQFSHLWDMQHHTVDGVPPSHGFKVGIGTLASVALYENLLSRKLESFDVDHAVHGWPSLEKLLAQVTALFEPGELADKALLETQAKYVTADELRAQLTTLQAAWPALCARLQAHLLPFAQLQSMLAAAGCPTQPVHLGISASRLRHSYWQALFIRRRFTVLDLAHRAGLLDDCLDQLFSGAGPWACQHRPPANKTEHAS